MSDLTHLRAADRKAQAWKNNGGITYDVAIFPPASGLDDFAWRVSIAEVSASGPFSRFDGIDRVLAVIEGEIALLIGACAPVKLGDASEPLRFPGDLATSGRLVSDRVRDCNIMVRRGCFHATARWARGMVEWRPQGPSTRLVLAVGRASLRCGQQTVTLEPLDAALLTGEGPITTQSDRPMLLIEICEHPR